MLTKKIKYVDYDGNEREEVFRFNLTLAEAAEMEVSEVGGLVQFIQKIVAEQDHKKLIEMFKWFILTAYGEKSPDGKRFIKSKELSEAFSQTPAYVSLFMELANNAEAAAAFFNAIIPQESIQKKS